jgi:hypothetical protein
MHNRLHMGTTLDLDHDLIRDAGRPPKPRAPLLAPEPE